MTTYSLNGFAVYYSNILEEDVGTGVSGITLDFVLPDTTTTLSYSVLPLAPGDEAPDDLYVDTTFDSSTIRLNGQTVGPNFQYDTSIFTLQWTDNGGVSFKSTTVYIAEMLDVNVPGFGLVDANYVFAIGGDTLPTFASSADGLNFLDTQLTGLGIPTNSYGPGLNIPFSSFGAAVTQNDIITGTEFKDVFNSGKGRDKVNGLGGNDVINGSNGRDNIRGGADDDRLIGGNGNDKLFGDQGADSLTGGRGDDFLVGGSGADDFFFNDLSGHDTIKDFNATNNQEDINLKAVTNIVSFQDLVQNHMTQVGNDVIIDDGAAVEITLLNVQIGDLHKADFIF